MSKLKRLTFDLETAEYTALEQQATLWGCSVAEALRVCVIGHLGHIEAKRKTQLAEGGVDGYTVGRVGGSLTFYRAGSDVPHLALCAARR